ncbi:hypothetical protein WSS15_10520 [Acetobacter pasteurianus]|nr:hypothetical protein WSS15_10520 [Acetobacter pasteurianus]
MNKQAVPSAAILSTVAIYLVGVVLNYFIPSQIFEIMLSLASLGILSTWCFIVLCQIQLRKKIRRGEIAPTSFPMPGAPFTSWLALAFFIGIVGLMAFDYPTGTATICAIPLLALALAWGWRRMRSAPEHDAVPQTVPSVVLTEDFLVPHEGSDRS